MWALEFDGASSATTLITFLEKWGVFSMKKMLKSKLVVGLVGVSVIFFSVNVYATTTLNASVLSIISSNVQSIGQFFSGETKSEIADITSDSKADISSYVVNKITGIDTTLNQLKAAEVARANDSIDTHFNQLVTETNVAFDTAVNKEKEKIKAEVDKEIAKSKSDLTAELEKKLKEKLEEKTKSYNGNGHDRD